MKGFLNKVQNSVVGGGKDGKSSEGGMIDGTPRADVILPKKSDRRRSSLARHNKSQMIKELPLLSETPMLKREALFRQKLQLCCTLFDFDDPDSDIRGKEIKRETLVELAEYVNTPAGQKIFTEALMPDIIQMVRVNLLRTLPAPSENFDLEEDEPAMEITWPHLQVVYEFFLRFVVSAEVNGKVAKRYVDQAFLRHWIDLFDAEDPRERDYVKTVLHRMYGKFMSYRSYIRKVIAHVFFEFVSETGRHNGIAELLEILGSIINGFAIPLKKEHIQFLERSLLPLHKPRGIAAYHAQLSYCISQYVEKDPETIVTIVDGLVRYWPWTNAAKQVLFLNELEEILELCRAEQLLQVQDTLYKLLAQCLSSTHFQVIERVLYFWNSEHLCLSLLAQSKASILLPYVFGPLSKSAAGHWNQAVEGLAQSVLKMFMEMDIALYERCAREHAERTKLQDAEREAARLKWEQLLAGAKKNGIDVDSLLSD